MSTRTSLVEYLRADMARLLNASPLSLCEIATRTDLDVSLLSRIRCRRQKTINLDHATLIYRACGEEQTLAVFVLTGGTPLKSDAQRALAQISLQAAVRVIQAMPDDAQAHNPVHLAEFDAAVHQLSRQVRPGARRGRPQGSAKTTTV